MSTNDENSASSANSDVTIVDGHVAHVSDIVADSLGIDPPADRQCNWGFSHNRKEDYDILKHPDYAERLRQQEEHRIRMNELYERQALARTILIEKAATSISGSIDVLVPAVIAYWKTLQ
jgi:hypothetical protein